MRRPFAVLLGLLTVSTALALPAAAADPPADGLRAGVGRAYLTSPTGYFMHGWVRSDAVLEGVHTRIQARDRARAERQGARAGRRRAQRRLGWRGRRRRRPAARPRLQRAEHRGQLYAFEVRRLAEAIAAADDDLGPAELGWGSTTLVGGTRNRADEGDVDAPSSVSFLGERLIVTNHAVLSGNMLLVLAGVSVRLRRSG